MLSGKCKHGRQLYYENRICRECMAEREEELLAALRKAREQLRGFYAKQAPPVEAEKIKLPWLDALLDD